MPSKRELQNQIDSLRSEIRSLANAVYDHTAWGANGQQTFPGILSRLNALMTEQGIELEWKPAGYVVKKGT